MQTNSTDTFSVISVIYYAFPAGSRQPQLTHHSGSILKIQTVSERLRSETT